jgi:hypothetical protein
MAEDTKDWSDEDFIVHALNIHGTFFERWCQKTVDGNGNWLLKAINYPVEFPRGSGHESALDLWAERPIQDYRKVSLIVECKKNNPEYTSWVFFSKDPELHCVSHPGSQYVNAIVIDRFAPAWSPALTVERFPWPIPIADEAREVKSNYRKVRDGDRSRTSNREITDAAAQVIIATQACAQAEYEDCCYLRDRPGAAPYAHHFFLPVIVTTAELLLCGFDSERVDPVSGEIPRDEVTLVPKEMLLFEYALPVRLQRDTAPQRQAGHNLDPYTRTHILVINSRAFDRALTGMATNSEATLGGGGFYDSYDL